MAERAVEKLSERIVIDKAIARARREIEPRPITIAALAELATVRDLAAFKELRDSSFGAKPEAYPRIAMPPPVERAPPPKPFDAVGMLASSQRVHARRLAMLTAMSAEPVGVAALVEALGERYAVHCTGSVIGMAAQDLAYLKGIGRVGKIGGCRDATWVRVR